MNEMLLFVDCNLSKNIVLSRLFLLWMLYIKEKQERGSGIEGNPKSGSILVIPGHLSYMLYVRRGNAAVNFVVYIQRVSKLYLTKLMYYLHVWLMVRSQVTKPQPCLFKSVSQHLAYSIVIIIRIRITMTLPLLVFSNIKIL